MKRVSTQSVVMYGWDIRVVPNEETRIRAASLSQPVRRKNGCFDTFAVDHETSNSPLAWFLQLHNTIQHSDYCSTDGTTTATAPLPTRMGRRRRGHLQRATWSWGTPKITTCPRGGCSNSLGETPQDPLADRDHDRDRYLAPPPPLPPLQSLLVPTRAERPGTPIAAKRVRHRNSLSPLLLPHQRR